MLKTYVMERVLGVYQLFLKLCADKIVHIVVAKFLDDFLVSRWKSDIQKYCVHLYQSFSLGATNIRDNLRIICAIFIKTDRFIELFMSDYLRRIKPLCMSEELKYHCNSMADDF